MLYQINRNANEFTFKFLCIQTERQFLLSIARFFQFHSFFIGYSTSGRSRSELKTTEICFHFSFIVRHLPKIDIIESS